jgi:hypothetical protein
MMPRRDGGWSWDFRVIDVQKEGEIAPLCFWNEDVGNVTSPHNMKRGVHIGMCVGQSAKGSYPELAKSPDFNLISYHDRHATCGH